MPALQFRLNNSVNAVTGKAPNEISLGFLPREVITAVAAPAELRKPSSTATTDPKPPFEKDRFVFRKEASDATSFAAAKAKIAYDSRHQELKLNPGDYVYLRLHRDYSLPGKANSKLSNQRTGPFLVKRRIGRLAYELDLPPQWRIHPVISVSQLEPVPADTDPYQRPRPSHPDAVEVEGAPNTEYEKSYEVEKLVGRRVRTFGRTPVTQYLVRWLGYGKEFDEWKSLPALARSLALVEDYELRNPIIAKPAVLPKPAKSPVQSKPATITTPPRPRGRPRKKAPAPHTGKRQAPAVQHTDAMI